jgi:phosphoglucomutase
MMGRIRFLSGSRGPPPKNASFRTIHSSPADAPATPEQKNLLKKLSPEAVTATELAGEPITAKLTRAPGNDAPVGGLKVVSTSGWFAARPSGTENVYKLYAERLKSDEHLASIVEQAKGDRQPLSRRD